jgi:hypothetical protein
MKKLQKMKDDQFHRELPIWMQSMIQWMDHQMKSCQHSPLEGEWTHLVCEIHMPRIWFLILKLQV